MPSTNSKFTLEQIRKIINEFPTTLIPVGSVNFKTKDIGDIDLITMTPLNQVYDFFNNKFKITEVLASGPKKLFFTIEVKGEPIEINIWKTTKSEFPYMYFSKLYPTKFNIKIRNKLKLHGYKLNDKGLYKDNKKVDMGYPQPIDFFNFADIEYRTPEEEYQKNLAGGNIITELYDRVRRAIFGPREGPSPQVRNFLKDHGNSKIINMYVCRTPIYKEIDTALNWISLGVWNRNKKKLGYDKMFHLYMVVILKNDKNEITSALLEKNEVVYIIKHDYKKDRLDEDCMIVELNKEITLNELVKNGERLQDKRFWLYNPANNNCQVFIMTLLNGNDIGSSDLEKFVKQDSESILTGYALQIAETVTDLAARANLLRFGKGLKYKIKLL